MYLIKNGRVHVGDGSVLESCDILIKDKKIFKMGKNLQLSLEDGDIEVIDASNREVFPGFIDPVSSIGAMGIPSSYMDNDEKADPISPEMNIKYSMDPDELNRQEFYKSGITSIGLSPTGNAIMGGQMAVVKTGPLKYHQRIVKEEAGLKCSVSVNVKETYGPQNRLPMTKMGIFYLFKESLRAARCEKADKRTCKQKAIVEIFDQKKMPVFCQASSKGEIDGILHMWENEKTDLNIVDGFCFSDSIDKFIERKAGLVLGNVNMMSQIGKNNMDLSKLLTLQENGNRIAFTNTMGGYSEGREVFLWTAIEAYRAGLPEEEVVRMMCENPSYMLGLEDRIGRLKEGMDADISIFTGHPVSTYRAKVQVSIIDGEVIFNEKNTY